MNFCAFFKKKKLQAWTISCVYTLKTSSTIENATWNCLKPTFHVVSLEPLIPHETGRCSRDRWNLFQSAVYTGLYEWGWAWIDIIHTIHSWKRQLYAIRILLIIRRSTIIPVALISKTKACNAVYWGETPNLLCFTIVRGWSMGRVREKKCGYGAY